LRHVFSYRPEGIVEAKVKKLSEEIENIPGSNNSGTENKETVKVESTKSAKK
jgi:hypothetical protein